MLVTAITPTGGRPQAFALCEKWMKQQTYKGDIQWIVIDDDPTHDVVTTMGQEVYKAEKLWEPHINTQRSNMAQALKHVKGEVILFFEDDDKYHPEYIKTMITLLETAEIAGLSNNRYFHVGVPGYKFMNNYAHSSLCSTAIKKSQMGRITRAVESGHFYFDIQLFSYCKEDGIPIALLANTNLVIGIKGMPGRAGLSGGHDKSWYTEDPELKVLEGWLGKDAEEYKKFIQK